MMNCLPFERNLALIALCAACWAFPSLALCASTASADEEIQALSVQMEALKKRAAESARKQAELARRAVAQGKLIANLRGEQSALGVEVKSAGDHIAQIQAIVANNAVTADKQAEYVLGRVNTLLGLVLALTALVVVGGSVAFRAARQRNRSIEALRSSFKVIDESLGRVQEHLIATNATAASAFDAALMHQKLATKAESQLPVATEAGHELPLKVALEVHRMRRRVASISSDLKGIAPLTKALDRLSEHLQEMGYEIVDYAAAPYNDGMHVEARFVPDESLQPGERRIAKTLKPQVHFCGKLIQVAEVEVGIGG